ncbi:HIT domain-containing protein [Spiroplasma taiwanense]|uniref:Histidine triad protein n=1 Tax=Spiroplasma taiwanense CT-1 TaxID=1276220 RepID=S5M0H5_9MOLU|nr:HIT domain-containing protein [Spiroplasma taiwanense]AGR41497.1 histidine triad protein [Spiroplasma taiwanense CT-1]
MNECIFCKIIAREMEAKILFENEHTIAFLDLYPNSDGHSLVIPKKHFENFQETDDFYLSEVVKTKRIVTDLLNEKLNPVGFNFVSNQGVEAFQTVFHYHEHIIPKYHREKGLTFKVNKEVDDLDDLHNIHKKLKN